MTETNQFLAIASRGLSLVTILITWPAKWQGKWILNTSAQSVRDLGGPWDTEEAAIAAVMATGRWKLRSDTTTTHFDRS